jgi:hypothetical protein
MRGLPGLVVVCVLLGVVCSCSYWDDEHRVGDDSAERIAERLLPNTEPSARGLGPLIPGTPGLRVSSGYFSRARMGSVDLYMPHTMTSFLRGREKSYLRIEAFGEKVGAHKSLFHAFIPLSIAAEGDLSTLENLTLEKEALKTATATIRVAKATRLLNRLVELRRLSLEVVDEHLVTGTLEGVTKRGNRAQSSLPFQLGFVAYRGPDTGMVGPERPIPDVPSR